MQAWRQQRPWTALRRMRETGLFAALGVCMMLAMALLPSAHALAMTLGGAGHGAVGVGLSGDVRIAPEDAMAVLAPASQESHHAAHRHGDGCCEAGDSAHGAGAAADACMTACCSAVVTDAADAFGGGEPMPVVLPLPVPASAGGDGSHPPPRCDRVT